MGRVPLLVFSHLRWNFVSARPRHIMTRLAQRRPVLFVEEPVYGERARLELEGVAGPRVCRPQLPIRGRAFGQAQEETLTRLLQSQMARDGWNEFAAWLYTPMAVRIARALNASAFVYDCMDEMSAFLDGPKELIDRDRELMGIADIVFTGGPSPYRSRPSHPFVRCFPGEVDVDPRTLGARIPEPDDLASLAIPRFGYFGVIDERIDLTLVAALADARPGAAIVMTGPVVDIDPATLPRKPNIHYLGPRPYDDLPAYASSWDVCMLPFAMGAEARLTSPGKVLDVLAAERPVASTPIQEVVESYGDIVYVGQGPQGFVDACVRALEDGDSEREARRARASQALRRSSWDETARHMDEILRFVADSGQSRTRLAISAPAMTLASAAGN